MLTSVRLVLHVGANRRSRIPGDYVVVLLSGLYPSGQQQMNVSTFNSNRKSAAKTAC
jgi:hypothetical protein